MPEVTGYRPQVCGDGATGRQAAQSVMLCNSSKDRLHGLGKDTTIERIP